MPCFYLSLQFAVQNNLTECLICLGGASVLGSALLKLGLSRIIGLAEHLWSACQVRPLFSDVFLA